MFRSSLPIGSFLGVDVRVHLSFPLLLALALGLSATFTHGLMRGFALWLALCFAVLVREVARSIAAACNGLHLRAIYLLPIGGVMAFSSADGAALGSNTRTRSQSSSTRWVTLSGPAANVFTGLFIMAFCYGVDPHVALFAQPWIDLHHILRSNLWTQFILGGVSLLPAMPSRRLLRSSGSHAQSSSARKVFSPLTMIGVAMIIAGILFPDAYFLILLGIFVMLYAQVSSRHAQTGSDSDAILVRDVMLTEYTLLSGSDTLRHALDMSVHSLHEVFPVVRGNQLVGAIARQTIAERLLIDGDSYLQGAMSRNLALTSPDEKLVDAIRRSSGAGISEMIPVIENGYMIGIVAPQSLPRAVQQIKLLRPPPQTEQP